VVSKLRPLGARRDGARPAQLRVCRGAPPADFLVGRPLEAECPGYSWRAVAAGWFRFLQEVAVPLDSPPCQVGPGRRRAAGPLRVVRAGTAVTGDG
jgi:hypothetical protein